MQRGGVCKVLCETADHKKLRNWIHLFRSKIQISLRSYLYIYFVLLSSCPWIRHYSGFGIDLQIGYIVHFISMTGARANASYMETEHFQRIFGKFPTTWRIFRPVRLHSTSTELPSCYAPIVLVLLKNFLPVKCIWSNWTVIHPVHPRTASREDVVRLESSAFLNAKIWVYVVVNEKSFCCDTYYGKFYVEQRCSTLKLTAAAESSIFEPRSMRMKSTTLPCSLPLIGCISGPGSHGL